MAKQLVLVLEELLEEDSESYQQMKHKMLGLQKQFSESCATACPQLKQSFANLRHNLLPISDGSEKSGGERGKLKRKREKSGKKVKKINWIGMAILLTLTDVWIQIVNKFRWAQSFLHERHFSKKSRWLHIHIQIFTFWVQYHFNSKFKRL